MKERQARKAAAKGIILRRPPAIEEKPRGQREQPKRKDRVKPPVKAGEAAASKPGIEEDAAPTDSAPAKTPAKPRTKPAVSTSKKPGIEEDSGPSDAFPAKTPTKPPTKPKK